MTRIGIRELNQHTSRYAERLKAGETIELTDRGELIGRLVPASTGNSLLDQLVAEGRAIPATADPATLSPPPPSNDGINASDVLIAMREEEPW